MKTLQKELWQLSLAMESLSEMGNEEVIVCYSAATVLFEKTQDNFSEAEHAWAQKLVNQASEEMKRRDLNIRPIVVSMDPYGNFLSGREELKKVFLAMDFQSVKNVTDKMFKKCNDFQRQALTDLECEVILET